MIQDLVLVPSHAYKRIPPYARSVVPINLGVILFQDPDLNAPFRVLPEVVRLLGTPEIMNNFLSVFVFKLKRWLVDCIETTMGSDPSTLMAFPIEAIEHVGTLKLRSDRNQGHVLCFAKRRCIVVGSLPVECYTVWNGFRGSQGWQYNEK